MKTRPNWPLLVGLILVGFGLSIFLVAGSLTTPCMSGVTPQLTCPAEVEANLALLGGLVLLIAGIYLAVRGYVTGGGPSSESATPMTKPYLANLYRPPRPPPPDY